MKAPKGFRKVMIEALVPKSTQDQKFFGIIQNIEALVPKSTQDQKFFGIIQNASLQNTTLPSGAVSPDVPMIVRGRFLISRDIDNGDVQS